MNNCTQARGGQREEPQLLKLQLVKINLGQEQLVKMSRLVTSGQNYLSHNPIRKRKKMNRWPNHDWSNIL